MKVVSGMSKYEIGQVVEGTVSGLQRYGAFILLDEETQGLVHISEITNGFVKEISDFLKIGDVVSVRVISISLEDGKIALSLREDGPDGRDREDLRRLTRAHDQPLPKIFPVETASGFAPLKEKLPEWIRQAK